MSTKLDDSLRRTFLAIADVLIVLLSVTVADDPENGVTASAGKVMVL